MQSFTSKHNQDIEEVKERLGTMKVSRFYHAKVAYIARYCHDKLSVRLSVRLYRWWIVITRVGIPQK